MATIPTPRSFPQIVGDMLDAFLSRTGLKSLKVGNPATNMVEAAAQSDLRSSQDIFQLLDSDSLDLATGIALDRHAADEDLSREPATAGTTNLTFGDSAFEKVSTTLFQGKPIPLIGSSTIYVVDASNFPNSGQLYIGRGTQNYEGPLTFTSVVSSGAYYTITLSGATKTARFHNTGETVVLAQGGDRTIPAGTLASTPGTQTPVRYATSFLVTIPDGETEVTNVLSVAQTPGSIGGVGQGALSQFVTAPFATATVTNPNPVTNAFDIESDDSLRERIKQTRASRAKGTRIAIKSGVLGVTAQDQNTRVTSSSVVKGADGISSLYIDNGTGYEETQQSVPIENLIDYAIGGEDFVQLQSGTPISKASLKSTLSSPFSLFDGATLGFTVGGDTTTHVFSPDEFLNISNASAYELVAAINADPALLWSARTSDNGTKVVVFAKAETNEDIQLTPGYDANTYLGFTADVAQTLKLYKNDILLSKDGKTASLVSAAQSTWSAMSGTQTLVLAVDGTASITVSVFNTTFAELTSYSTVASTNSLDAWATVLTAVIPGVTASVELDTIVLTSNKGRSSKASIRVISGTLVSNGMFVAHSVTGSDNDYSLNRSSGQISLNRKLAAGDKLAAGTTSTRAFVQSSALSTVTLSSDATLYFAVDGDAAIVTSTIGVSTALSISITSNEMQLKATGLAGAFDSLLPNDWIIIWDDNIDPTNHGVWRINFRKTVGSDSYLYVTRDSATAESFTLASPKGISFARSSTPIQSVVVPAGTYTAANFATYLTGAIDGASASTYQTSRIRVFTNTYGETGSIGLVAQDSFGALLGFTPAVVSNTDSQLASIESNSELGTQRFYQTKAGVGGFTGTSVLIDATTATDVESSDILEFAKDIWVDSTHPRMGALRGETLGLRAHTGTTLTLRDAAREDEPQNTRLVVHKPFALSPEDTLAIQVDDDSSKRYVTNTFRNVGTINSTYTGTTLTLKDLDNGASPVTLASAFGTQFNFKDFAVFMKARGLTHAGTTKAMLWRYFRYGPEGELARVRYAYPESASQPVAVETELDTNVSVSVKLASGAAKVPAAIRNTTYVGMAWAAGATPPPYKFLYTFNLNVVDVTNSTSNVTVLFESPSGWGITNCGLAVNDVVYWVPANGAATAYTAGAYTVTAINVGANGLKITMTNGSAPPTGGHITGASLGLLSKDASGVASVNGASIVTGDIASFVDATFSVGDLGGINPYGESYAKATRITTVGTGVGASSYVETSSPDLSDGAGHTLPATSNTLIWRPIGLASNVSFYPLLPTNTLTNIAASVQTIADAADSTCPVTAAVVGTGSQVVSLATYDEFAYSYESLVDGLNFVDTVTLPGSPTGNYIFNLKDDVNTTLASNPSGWATETLRLVPLTALNVADFLGTQASGGLYGSTNIDITESGHSVQVSSLTPGSDGSIQVQGGTATQATASVVGSSSTVSSRLVATVRKEDAVGFNAGQSVSLQNTATLPKVFNSGVAFYLNSIGSDGWFTFSNTSSGNKVWTERALFSTKAWSFRREGRYMAIVPEENIGTWATAGIPVAGDWINIRACGAPNTAAISTQNLGTGWFRVIAGGTIPGSSDQKPFFWIENANGIEETVDATISLIAADSAVPGDIVTIGTNDFGEDNRGSWTIDQIDPASQYRFHVTGTLTAQTVNALVTPANLLSMTEGVPMKLVKTIKTIMPNQTDSGSYDIVFVDNTLYTSVGEAGGTLITVLDKLGFSSSIAQGRNGYSYSTGLVGEVNRVIYGDESDPVTYPGIAAEGSSVIVKGPLVKRISVSVQIRIKNVGASADDIKRQVRTAVAAVINSGAIGQPISLSSIVSAAQAASGVQSVVVTSPTYDLSNDLIALQPYEKPMVLNVEQDIFVAFLGE